MESNRIGRPQERFLGLSLGATGLLVVTVVTLYLRHALFGANAITVALQAVAMLLMLWARAIMRGRSFHASAAPSRGALVTRGPYRFIRHPIYAATLLFLWAGMGSHASASNVTLGLVASACVIVRIVTEERLLSERYPEYAEYSKHTKRLLPFLV